jgi:hypothetical protein
MEDRCDHTFTFFLGDLTDPAYLTIFAALQHGGWCKTREIIRCYDLHRTLDNFAPYKYLVAVERLADQEV